MSRRLFLQQSSALGMATLLGFSEKALAERPPEVKKIRLIEFPAICVAPGYLAEELLLAEGFEEVEYVKVAANTLARSIGSGRVDLYVDSAPGLVAFLDSTDTVLVLGGVHAGCYELLGNEGVQAIRDLKHRSVAVSALGSTDQIFVSSMAAYVGIDPRKDIEWRVCGTSVEAMRAFSEGRADAFLGFAPKPHELRAKKIGHVIVNTTQDRPWSQYFCCMLTGNRDFVRKNPIATKRAMRAFLKAADICASEPERAARFMVDRGYATSYEVALEIIGELPYRRWRDANPEDTIRFHALRLHEAGIIRTNPQKLIERGTDWRFFNQLKQELKA